VNVVFAIRPDDWNVPLTLHVFGSMLLIGTLLAAVLAFAYGWRRDDARDAVALNRLGWWTLLLGVLPSFVLQRASAQWIYAEEFDAATEDPTWVEIGFISTDVGLLLLVIAMILAGIGARRLRRTPATSSRLSRAAGVLSALLLVTYLVVVWAMTAKPG
jgi:hypothetical protein